MIYVLSISLFLQLRITLKTITYIISFVILGLGLFPCSDVMGGQSSAASNQYSANLSVDCDSAEGHQDICSPFCSCNCCGTTINNPKFSEFSLEILKHSPLYHESYYDSASESVFLPIWQPPKI